MAGDVRFARMSNGREVGYSIGPETDGPVIVHITEGPYPLDLLPDDAMYERFLRTLGRAGRVLLFDRPGIGASDPFDRDADLIEQTADAYPALLDAAGVDAAWIIGSTLPVLAKTIERHRERVIGTMLFTDLVDSTPSVAAHGDTVWRSTLDRYEKEVRRLVERHHGSVIKHTGDGVLATLPSGTQAVAAAFAIRNATIDLGLEGRAGVHVGEVETRGDDIGGIAVHVAARVMSHAEPGQIVVTSTACESMIGGATRFEDLGEHDLKGVARPWRLWSATSGD